MKVAFLTIDNREVFKLYDKTRPFSGSAPDALLHGFAGLPGLEVHVISCIRRPVVSPEKLADNIWFHSLVVPQMGWMRTFYWGCIRAVRRTLGQIRPDIVHGQGSERECAMTAAFSGRPNLITIHGNMREVAKSLGARPFSFNWLAGRLESIAIGRTGGVVCLTRYTQRLVSGLARKTWLVPNAVNEVFFDLQREVRKEPTILCVANLNTYKNQNGLIRALDPIAAERNFRLVFVGVLNPAYPYCHEFQALIKTRPWCVFEGFQKGEQLRAYFRSATMLVLPSLEENCPMAVLEAMAAGLPVAASAIGGIPDLIDDGVSGLLFDPLNPDQIRAAVLRLLDDQPAAEAMGAAGRKRALKCHHPREIARRHVEIYEEVVERTKTDPHGGPSS